MAYENSKNGPYCGRGSEMALSSRSHKVPQMWNIFLIV